MEPSTSVRRSASVPVGRSSRTRRARRCRSLCGSGSKPPIDPEQTSKPASEEGPEAFILASGPTWATSDEPIGHGGEVSEWRIRPSPELAHARTPPGRARRKRSAAERGTLSRPRNCARPCQDLPSLRSLRGKEHTGREAGHTARGAPPLAVGPPSRSRQVTGIGRPSEGLPETT